MNAKTWTTAVLLSTALLPGLSQARDTQHFLNFQSVVDEATQAGRLDGSVKFYLNKTPAGAQIVRRDVSTSKKTNAFNKTDEAACSWALQSALIAMAKSAKAAGANAVVDLTSNYKNNVYRDNELYECQAGAVIAGVALKGNFAKVK